MKHDKDHIDFEKDFFGKTNIHYSKSKEDVWAEMESKLNKKASKKVLKFDFNKVVKYGIAASLIIGLGLLSFLRFYSVSITCPNGQHSSVFLPDSSKVTLNAGSNLAYHPFWWRFNRTIDFEGEAFFEVKKGKKFIVESEKGSTTVLGTSFNIYSRNNEYRVYCISGVVKVETTNMQTTVLMKHDYSIVNQDDKIVKLKNKEDTQNAVAWIKNEFVFTSMPIRLIYEEIERQFDITIEGKEYLRGISSFNTNRGSSPEEIIYSIGKPFGVKCVKISEKVYIVEQK